MSWSAVFGLWLRRVWKSAGRAIVTVSLATMTVFLSFMGHKRAVSRAEKRGTKQGTEQERERINTETERVIQERKERANEVRESTADLGDHELADRLRNQRERHRNR